MFPSPRRKRGKESPVGQAGGKGYVEKEKRMLRECKPMQSAVLTKHSHECKSMQQTKYNYSPNHLHLQVNGRHSEWRRETKDHEACRSRNNEMPGLQVAFLDLHPNIFS
ncbi:hypothetical protein SDJN03_12580, partial [Cucurbita argyrosperma subsp. sororia]